MLGNALTLTNGALLLSVTKYQIALEKIKSALLNESLVCSSEEMSREGQRWKKDGNIRPGVIHKLHCMLEGSCLIPEGNGELTPLIRGNTFQMCLNVVRPTVVVRIDLCTDITNHSSENWRLLYERGPLCCYVINNAKAPVLSPSVHVSHNPICTSDPCFAFLETAAFCPL